VPAERAHPRAPRAVSAKEPPAANWSTARLRARLIDGERPLPHATVLWSEIAGGSIAPPRESSTRTDADGVVELPNPELGAVVLGFVERDGLWLPFVRLRVPVAVGAIDLGDLAVAPRAVSGQVVDAHGAPVAGARVAVLPAAASDAELPYVTYTDHGGRYRFAALPSGPLRLWADCGTAGFASVDLDAAADVAVLQTPESGVISGVILSVDGQQFAGAWVMLVRSIGDTAMMPGVGRGTANLCVHADADGQVRVSGLPPGTWQVLGQGLRDGRLYGGGGTVATDGTFRLELRPVRG
ncbi:MAG: carboxypeptidase regulatory-like domain-containing protein, partial [Planctomycetes bacterium]|nr:carboxypeptidase regulatory-like domain-containing protein [Planctomycetota bacterium]